MKIGVISDTHDNIWKIREAVPHLSKTQTIIHCGDLCSPFVVRELAEPLAGLPIHIVWGNNEGDRAFISKVARDYPNVQLHGELAELDIDGLSVAAHHFPRIAYALALSGLYKLVCYGHDHQQHEQWVGDCLLINPGELMGMKGTSSLAIVEVETRKTEFIHL
jgi:putative phosphoesterase